MSRPLLVGQTELLKSSKNLIRLKGVISGLIGS